jgi:hypothetical protein
VTLLGEKGLSSVAMVDDKGDLFEVDPKNIIMPSLEYLPDDAHQLYEKQKISLSKRSYRCSLQSLRKISKVS